MIHNRLLVSLNGDRLQLSWQRGQEYPRQAPEVDFNHPFEPQVLADLRWYLEQYLSFPYGLNPDKAIAIEQKFQVWGQTLFELIFQSTEEGREFFQEATRSGLYQFAF